MSEPVFRDRVQAGQRLADALERYADRADVIVLGLPRGGVPVAWEVARKLQAPLDVMVVRKLGVPNHEELAMGAIASGGVKVIHESVVQALGISRADLEKAADKEAGELRRREQAYRGSTGAPDVRDKTVILVDDGVATGSTLRAAVQALRQHHPKQIIIAAPTASFEAFSTLRPLVDDFIALMVPADFHAVGQWYEDFSQTTDEEVKQLLAMAPVPEPAMRAGA